MRVAEETSMDDEIGHASETLAGTWFLQNSIRNTSLTKVYKPIVSDSSRPKQPPLVSYRAVCEPVDQDIIY